jgi:hypothetical protein
LYLPSAILFYKDSYSFNRIFSSHRLYQWSFPTAKLTSTIDPILFEHAVALIERYNPNQAIYLISKYDDILPILAGKYMAFPYPELATNLITNNDVNAMVSLINQAKPTYIFVDTDINRNMASDIFANGDPISKRWLLHDHSFDRAIVLTRLKPLFSGIKKDYRPIAKSELITVYQRVAT